jgi:hypothetical protein
MDAAVHGASSSRVGYDMRVLGRAVFENFHIEILTLCCVSCLHDVEKLAPQSSIYYVSYIFFTCAFVYIWQSLYMYSGPQSLLSVVTD